MQLTLGNLKSLLFETKGHRDRHGRIYASPYDAECASPRRFPRHPRHFQIHFRYRVVPQQPTTAEATRNITAKCLGDVVITK